jgi:HD-GYP domain-containing protein (c-di-GMP phosphodiesterase class II)
MTPGTLQALIDAIEAKDLCTAAHTWRVVLYSRALAEEAGMARGELERITGAAALHDLGKLDMPDALLQKPGPLTPEEFEVIKGHTVRGYERLVSMGETDPVLLELVRHHHERWDGLGYPDRLAGEAIAPAARSFAVIDAFDAMTTVRPYRKEVGPAAVHRALEELERGAGTRYWPEAVERFARLHRTGALDWIGEHFNDTCPVRYAGPELAAAAAQRRRAP